MPAKIVVNHGAVASILKSKGVTDKLMKVAAPVVEQAVATAPVGGKSDPHPGQFRDSIKAIPRESDKRAWVSVGSDLPNARAIEANHGTLHRALDAARGA